MNNPTLSIIIPARNEEKNIEQCIDSILAQDFQNFELILVDDHSNDKTREIIYPYVHKYKNISLIELKEKPEGWVGKNYALCRGFMLSKADLLLFIDADVKLSSSCLKDSMEIMNESDLDLLSLAAFQISEGFWIASLQPVIFLVLNILFPLKKVNDPKSSLSACNGIFIMMKKSSYIKIGTHEIIKDNVLEDLALGKIIKSRGMKLKFIYKPDLIKVRMYSRFSDLFEGWSKNFFAILDFSIYKSIAISTLLILSFWGMIPFFLIIKQTWLCFAWIFTILTIISIIYSKMHYKKILSLLYPIGSIIFPIIILNSLVCYTIKGRVKWKNRYYKVN